MPKETAIIAYKKVHTGPKSQPGGAHDGLINNEKEISFNLSGQIVNYKNIVVEKDKQIDLGEEEMNKMKKEIRRQKFQKYLLIGAVLVVSAVGIIY